MMKLLISWHTSMVGGALVRRFIKVPYSAIIAAGNMSGMHANITYQAFLEELHSHWLRS